MVACKYKIEGTDFKDKSIEDLYRYLDEKQLYNSVEDVIYSQENEIQIQQEQILRDLRELSLKTIDSSSLDEEGNEVGEHNEMSIS